MIERERIEKALTLVSLTLSSYEHKIEVLDRDKLEEHIGNLVKMRSLYESRDKSEQQYTEVPDNINEGSVLISFIEHIDALIVRCYQILLESTDKTNEKVFIDRKPY